MKYDFTSILNRTGLDAIAVEPETDPYGIAPKGQVRPGFDLIPMWVADMNFPTVPTICQAIAQRAMHPAFGYFVPRPEYYSSIIDWQRTRNGVEGLQQAHIGYQNGVLGGIMSTLSVLCSAGDNILVHAPTYAGFIDDIGRSGYHLVPSYLKRDEENVWRMDYADMEQKIVQYHIHTALFCSPHNPTGRVWTREEILQAMEIFRRHDVYVIADEIWSDLTLYGNRHVPTQSVSEDARQRTVAFYAPSKTFNLAGLIGSYHIIYNDYLRDRITYQSSLGMYNNMNVLSMYALIGAHMPEGAQWVDELRTALEKNVDYAYAFVTDHFEGVRVSKPQGTYMMFLDCRAWCQAHNKTIDQLLESGVGVGVLWQDGRQFNSPGFIRLNLALPFSRVVEAFNRLDRYVF